MKWSLVSRESLNPNSEKIEGFYKGDNFINDIAFGASLFVFCDLNIYFQYSVSSWDFDIQYSAGYLAGIWISNIWLDI